MAMAACATLVCKCAGMVPGTVNLLLDIPDDEVEVLRGQAMQERSRMAMTGLAITCLCRTLHLHMVRLLHYSSLSLTMRPSTQKVMDDTCGHVGDKFGVSWDDVCSIVANARH